jgi:hypothetical protein
MEPSCAVQTYGETDTAKLIVGFRNSSIVPEKELEKFGRRGP